MIIPINQLKVLKNNKKVAQQREIDDKSNKIQRIDENRMKQKQYNKEKSNEAENSKHNKRKQMNISINQMKITKKQQKTKRIN